MRLLGDEKMKTCIVILIGLALIPAIAQAVPTFQVYVNGGTAGSLGGDEDTWFTSLSSFDLVVVGAFSSNTMSLSDVTLVASAPQGQTGTLIVNGATLQTSKTPVQDGYYNPNANADTDILTNIAGIDGYSTKSFLPASQDNHYPFQNNVSDFVLFSVGDFSNEGAIHDYNADNGSTSLSGSGQEKVFHIETSGFDWLHFDVYGYETTARGNNLRSTWEDNPNSHDSTYTTPTVPAPSALILAGIGLSCVWKTRKQWK
jgi:hypothetical protein